MTLKLRYKQKLFLYFAIIFAVFVVGVLAFEYSRNKTEKTKMLTEKLSDYAKIASKYYDKDNVDELNKFASFLPPNLRLTVVERNGIVRYDNVVPDVKVMSNHSERPEIEQAFKAGEGTDIRMSESTKKPFLYYAFAENNLCVRVALPYDVDTKQLLQADHWFLAFVILFFIVILLIINVVSNRFGKSIAQLRDFALSAGKDTLHSPDFPKDELGEIGAQLAKTFADKRATRKKLMLEREKLLQHIHSSEEGICFFSSDKGVSLYNGLFIQYLNIISDEPSSEPQTVLKDSSFKEVLEFVNSSTTNYLETTISRHGRTFSIRVNRFEDFSFEIVLNDITKKEKTRLLKQEMTGNIAHELRTPVTSIRGYLETIIEQKTLTNEQRDSFINQAYKRTIDLSNLIQDISLLNTIEEAPQKLNVECVELASVLNTVKMDYIHNLEANRIEFTHSISSDIKIMGNKNLIYTLFRNLTDNAIRYAGEGVSINVRCYKEDDEYYYFSFADNGMGIANEQQLNRLFERFYRINEGRTRNNGGTGLGLSIVKNAIAFHRGTIIAKNRVGGGLEFLFHLHK